MNEHEMVLIDEGDIAEYVYGRLLEKGYTVTSDEILDLAEIMFDYLVDKSVIMNVAHYESEEE